jgi:hypothetical protein
MTDSMCGYQGDRDQALVAFLYDDGGDWRERGVFEGHLTTCALCREELATLSGVRAQLARWAPPEPAFSVTNGNVSSAMRNPQSPWWREIPAWAQVAAALLFLGVSAGIANLDVRYAANGLSVRTGWTRPPSRDPRVAGPPATDVTVAPNDGALSSTPSAPWRADLAALERQLNGELRAMKASTMPATPARASTPDAEVLRRVHALLDESEKRQQRELALRVAEVMRDVTAQRQADLVKIDRTLGLVQNNLGVEVMKDRQRLNTLLIRTSGRQ